VPGDTENRLFEKADGCRATCDNRQDLRAPLAILLGAPRPAAAWFREALTIGPARSFPRVEDAKIKALPGAYLGVLPISTANSVCQPPSAITPQMGGSIKLVSLLGNHDLEAAGYTHDGLSRDDIYFLMSN